MSEKRAKKMRLMMKRFEHGDLSLMRKEGYRREKKSVSTASTSKNEEKTETVGVHHHDGKCTCCGSAGNVILFHEAPEPIENYPVHADEAICRKCLDRRKRLAAEAELIEDTGLAVAAANA